MFRHLHLPCIDSQLRCWSDARAAVQLLDHDSIER